MPLPYGLGFHPWLAREENSQLRFNATGCWLEDFEHLPTEHVPPGSGFSTDFSTEHDFPDGLLNNAYTGWDRIADLIRPQHRLSVQVTGFSRLLLSIVNLDQLRFFLCQLLDDRWLPLRRPCRRVRVDGFDSYARKTATATP